MQTILIIIGVLIAAFILLRFIAMRRIKNTPMVDDHEKILTLTDKNFKQQTKNKLVLVDFWAEWCAPCRVMAPILNDIAAELNGNTHIGKVDIQKYQSMAQQHKVKGIPTLILFKNGKEVKRLVGIKTKEFLLNEINKVS